MPFLSASVKAPALVSSAQLALRYVSWLVRGTCSRPGPGRLPGGSRYSAALRLDLGRANDYAIPSLSIGGRAGERGTGPSPGGRRVPFLASADSRVLPGSTDTTRSRILRTRTDQSFSRGVDAVRSPFRSFSPVVSCHSPRVSALLPETGSGRCAVPAAPVSSEPASLLQTVPEIRDVCLTICCLPGFTFPPLPPPLPLPH